MIISGVVIAGSLGAGTLGAIKYRDRKRLLASRPAGKREYPWTVAAERMGVYPLVRRKPENRLVATGKAALSKGGEQQKRLASKDSRQQQLAARTSDGGEAQISVNNEQEANRLLAISGGLFAMGTASLWIPALNIFCLPTALYLVHPYFNQCLTLFKERRMGLATSHWAARRRTSVHTDDRF